MPWWQHYTLIEWIIRLVMVPVLLRRRFMPSTTLAWLSLIFFVPELGLVVYLLFGGDRLAYRRVRRHRRFLNATRALRRTASVRERHAANPDLPPEINMLVQHAAHIGGMPILAGNHVEFIENTPSYLDRLVADIDLAQRHVHLIFYIYAPDPFGRRLADALCRACARGVKCRVLLDAVGSRKMLGSDLAATCRHAGVELATALPVASLRRPFARMDLRNHRKLVVIDGKVAHTGSHNVVQPDYGHWWAGPWIDLSGRYTGPIVAELQNVFLDDWLFETDQSLDGDDLFPAIDPTGDMLAQCVPTGPTQESESLLRVILAGINLARRQILITSPYFVPDEPTLVALTMAAERGAEVTLVLPRRSDHWLVSTAGRAYFEPLLQAGVKIYLHDKGMLHAKTMTVDDSLALLGSSNLDVRSFYLNFELNVLMYGPQITAQLRFAQTRYLQESEPVNLARWKKRATSLKYLEAASALLSPLL